jgi:hypothetical protein
VIFELLLEIADQNLKLFGLAFFTLLTFAVEVGYRTGLFVKRKGLIPEDSGTGAGFMLGGMLALLAFFLGIALSISSSQYQERQALVLAEANAIGSAWLIAGAQADNTGADIRRLLETYTKVRISAIEGVRTSKDKLRIVQRTGALQNEIWAVASDIAKQAPTTVSTLLLTALTEAFDNSVSQRAAFDKRIPTHLARLLTITTILALMAAGLSLGFHGNRMFLMSSLLVLVMVGAIALIIDISRPYQGATHISPDPLIWTLDSIQPAP